MHRTRRLLALASAATLAALVGAGPALACAGLLTPSGNVRLLRTATLAAWHDGVEHYITAFTFTGGGAEVGSIVPLPGVPDSVERGGDWTLQRLERETQPQPARASAPESVSATNAEVVYETRIDALDITILRGGGEAVAAWAREHGFSLTPDAPEVLDFYAARSPVFMAARFDATAARERGQEEGEGTPIHLAIPLEQPWVPLRILGLGQEANEAISADVYLLTPDRPALLPEPGQGLVRLHSDWASRSLLDDLRSDQGMEWVPQQAWLTHLRVDEQAAELRYDLAIDAGGTGAPSPVMAGLEPPPAPATTTTTAAPTTTTAPPSSTTSLPAPEPTPTTAVPAPGPTTAARAPGDPDASGASNAGAGASAAETPDRPLPEPEVALPAAAPAAGGGAVPVTVTAALLGGALGAGTAGAAAWWRARRRSPA